MKTLPSEIESSLPKPLWDAYQAFILEDEAQPFRKVHRFIDLIEVFGEGPSGEGNGDGVSGVWERGTKDDAHGLGITGIEIAAGEHEEIAGIFLEGVSDTDEIFWGKGGF